MASSNLPTHASAIPEGPPVRLWISPTIERNYVARGVFPELRGEHSDRPHRAPKIGAVYTVPQARVKELLADAQEQVRSGNLPKGSPKAFCTLIRDLERDLKPQDFKPQPKLAKVTGHTIPRPPSPAPALEDLERLYESLSAALRIGDKVRYLPFPDSEGEPAVVSEGYGYSGVIDDDGEHTLEGHRVSIRQGYKIKYRGRAGVTHEVFAAAHQLVSDGYAPSHMRMVRSGGPRSTANPAS